MQRQIKIFTAAYDSFDLEKQINSWATKNAVKIINVSISSVAYGHPGTDGDAEMFAVVVYEV